MQDRGQIHLLRGADALLPFPAHLAHSQPTRANPEAPQCVFLQEIVNARFVPAQKAPAGLSLAWDCLQGYPV